MSRILVTGATGFVGCSLIPALIEAGHEVLCAVTRQVDWLQAKQTVINKIEEQSDWSGVLEGIDVVIHLAARVHIMNDKAASPGDEFYKVNSLATRNLAEQAAKHGVKRFIFLSSIKVNGEFTLDNQPFTEESMVQTDDPYGKSKLQAERYLRSISHEIGMEYVILRPPLIFGPGVKANFLKMLQLIDKGWPLPFSKINNKRTFIYIDNLVSAICAVINTPGAANQTYLLADNESWSLSDLLSFLATQMQTKTKLFNIPGLLFVLNLPSLNNLKLRLLGSLEVSNNKIKSHLQWTPPVTSAEGLRKTVRWYKDECNS